MKISLRRRHALTVEYGAFNHKIDYVKKSKLYYWFKSYGDFAEWVDFAYWWSCIGKGLRLQPAQQACFKPSQLGVATVRLRNKVGWTGQFKSLGILFRLGWSIYFVLYQGTLG